MTSHLFIPDTQVKPKSPTRHLSWIGDYIVDKQPEVIIQIGDFADMPSMGSYDKGKKSFEGRRYKADVDAAHRGMEILCNRFRGIRGYSPRMVLTLGNHEDRIRRAAESQPELDGTISTDDLGYADFGWEVKDFLEVVKIDGVSYSHFFPRSGSGKVLQTRNGAPGAKAQLVREGASCTSGHAQGLDVSCLPLGGRLQWGLIAGSCYLHDESYLSPQGNKHWRGVVLKNGVKKGDYSPIFVSLDYLRKRYAK